MVSAQGDLLLFHVTLGVAMPFKFISDVHDFAFLGLPVCLELPVHIITLEEAVTRGLGIQGT
jgi:hypothetical protein